MTIEEEILEKRKDAVLNFLSELYLDSIAPVIPFHNLNNLGGNTNGNKK